MKIYAIVERTHGRDEKIIAYVSSIAKAIAYITAQYNNMKRTHSITARIGDHFIYNDMDEIFNRKTLFEMNFIIRGDYTLQILPIKIE